jgi:hypothetical protein
MVTCAVATTFIDKFLDFFDSGLELGDSKIGLVELVVAVIVTRRRERNVLQSVESLFMAGNCVCQIPKGLPRQACRGTQRVHLLAKR